MEGIASISGSCPRSSVKYLRKSEDITAVLEDEFEYESDSSDASWVGDLVQDSDMELSASESDEGNEAPTAPSKEGFINWTPNVKFRELNEFLSTTGIVHDLAPGSKEIDYLSLFLDVPFFEHLAAETNRFAAYKQRNNLDPKWENTSAKEVQAYLGILCYMGLVNLPETRDYFTEGLCICPIVRQAMTLQRFQKISQYFHLNDEEARPGPTDNNYDFLYKVRPALDVVKKFGVYFKPGCNLAIDEAMIGFKGRFSLKHYMPEKPTKWGIKAWGIADSKSGYLLDCKIYLGKKEERNKNLLLGEQVVLDISQNYNGLWHHIYFDNFFTSYRLMKLLLERNSYACGTARAGRKDWPAEFRQPKQLKLKRGESRKFQHEAVTAVVWRDNRDVLLLSTNSDPTSDVTVSRRTGKGREEIEVPCPQAVKNYTKNMGGVDRADQMREYYGVGRSSKKWWRYIFHFIMNVSIVNSFIIFDLSNRPERNSHGNRQLQFRRNLVTQLIGNFTSRKRVGAKRNLLLGITSPQDCHTLEKIQGRVKTCVQCATKKIRTLSGRGKQTAYKCKQCNISLCRVDCFLTYHQERGVHVQN